MESNNLYYSNLFAPDYDKMVVSGNWSGPALVYDLIKKDISPGAALIDLGIGTGESSRLFKNAGLQITGIDGSEEMLKICAGKNIAEKLVLFNLHDSPLPFPGNSFDFAVSHGVFHLLTRIEHLFSEVSRILTPHGLFVFTYDETNDTSGYRKLSEGTRERRTTTNVLTYRHDWPFIQKLLSENHFKEVERKTFLAYTNKELKEDFYFTAVVARKSV